MPYGAWYQLEFAISPATTALYINGKLAAESSVGRIFQGAKPLDFVIGGFAGFIDDVTVSRAVRAGSLGQGCG